MIFGKGSNRTASEIAAAKIETSEFPTLIGADMKVSGDITGGGELQIDGEIEGNLKAEHVVIGPKAVVRGSITAQTVFISGQIFGNIEAKNIEATETANVKGDLIHSELTIESGATIDGLCKPVSKLQHDSKSQNLKQANE